MQTNCTFSVDQPGVHGAPATPLPGMQNIPGQKQPVANRVGDAPGVEDVVYVDRAVLPTPVPDITARDRVTIGTEQYQVLYWFDMAGRGQKYKLGLRNVLSARHGGR